MDIKNYVVRIQLVDASDKDNLALDISMGHLGFGRLIVGKDGTRYYLPNMEYIIWTDENITDIKKSVMEMASSTGKRLFVLVTQAKEIEWDLPVVK